MGGEDTNFRRAMLTAIDCVKKAIPDFKNHIVVKIASGFYTENTIGKSTKELFNVSDFKDASEKSLISSLKGINVVCFGTYIHKKTYESFIKNIRKVANELHAYYASRFHCKVFVIELDGDPIFEIIGSSNMTKAAYAGISRAKKPSPNYESDLIYVDDTCLYLKEFSLQPNRETTILIYDESENGGITFKERMRGASDILDDFIKSGKFIEL